MASAPPDSATPAEAEADLGVSAVDEVASAADLAAASEAAGDAAMAGTDDADGVGVTGADEADGAEAGGEEATEQAADEAADGEAVEGGEGAVETGGEVPTEMEAADKAGAEAEPEAEPAGAQSPPDMELPKVPKRAKPAFSYFLDDKFGSRPSREAGDAWKALEDEAKRPYVERHEVDKARYVEEMGVYKQFIADHPELRPQAAGNDEQDDPASTILPLAKVKRHMRMANLKPNTAIAKDACFLVAKTTEAFLHMLTEQSAHVAVGAKRKKVGTSDFEHVLYGARNADLLDFLHGDFPKSAARATPVKAPKAPKPKRAKPPSAEEEGGDEPVENKENAKRRRGAAAAAAPAQSNSMLDFFGKKAAGAEEEDAAAAAPAEDGDGEGAAAADENDDENADDEEEEDEEEDEDEELLEDVGGAAPAAGGGGGGGAAGARKRRLALLSDDESDGEADS